MFTALIDSRRLPGANRYSRRAGAVIEVAVDPAHAESISARWRAAAQRLLDALHWTGETPVVAAWPGGLGLFVAAPLDGLLAATEVTEGALAMAESAGDVATLNTDDLLARIRVHVQHDRIPALVVLADEAARRGLVLSFDDDVVTVGSGSGAHTWPLRHIPAAREIPWHEIRDIPIALVTGANGKTTTTRLLSAMLQDAGFMPGHTCTDGVYVNGEQQASGDWSGPAGARRILCDPRVTAAVLETARGGILRRGLATTLADVAIVTRIAADHFGEYGVFDAQSLGLAKLVVARALRPGATLVLNADDDVLVSLAGAVEAPVAWFSLLANHPVVRAAVIAGASAAVLEDDQLRLIRDGQAHDVIQVRDLPIALDGAARHNVANALAALAAGASLGLATGGMAETLRRFGRSPLDNPGRLQLRRVHGANILVDFVHNPDGWTAMLDVARRLRTGRLIVTLGQAGDRNDADLDAMAHVVWAARPDVIVVKEMEEYLRGRPYGQVSELLSAALQRAGAPLERLRMAPDEVTASRVALEEARPGDVVIIAAHAAYEEVMQLCDALSD